MTKYTYNYFQVRGRGELARLVNAASGTTNVLENTIPFSEWPNLKGSFPNGQVPCLEANGKQIAQGKCIARFLARENNLAGKDKWDEATADSWVDSFGEVHGKFFEFFREKLEFKKTFAKGDMKANLAVVLGRVENILSDDKRYLVGDALTWADLALFALLDSGILEHTGDTQPGVKVQALMDLVRGTTAIKQYLETRPESVMGI